jgi:drug/metabolite transporter (DMT)-like permease
MSQATSSQKPANASVGASGAGRSMHLLGVVCGIAAGIWLGAAEAPTKLVDIGLSPFSISLCMVAGVFTARWSFPTLLRGTGYVYHDLRAKKHLIVWAVLAGALWAVANTLTVYAIRDVGLTIAFPLWNTNCLVGLLWGRLLFRELQGASRTNLMKVVLGTCAIIVAAIMLGFSVLGGGGSHGTRVIPGLLAALGASVLWGTMYIPYRKAYLSGMNPLSFVTAFTIGELGTMFTLAITLGGGLHHLSAELHAARSVIFWIFLGGFCWVIGDLFQQYATKYLGIGRGVPLSNTNQLWGLAWGVLVFGELAQANLQHKLLVIAGSAIMILGALAISTAAASAEETASTNLALRRETERYGLDYEEALLAMSGIEDAERSGMKKKWWDYAIVIIALVIFAVLLRGTRVPVLKMNFNWMIGLVGLLLVSIIVGGGMLWRKTKFY